MRRILPYAALALVAVVATPIVLAQGGSAPGAPDKSRVTAGTYAADPGHTLVVWEVDHFGFSKYSGIFGDVAGTLVIDPGNPAASKVDVTIPVSKVTTETPFRRDASCWQATSTNVRHEGVHALPSVTARMPAA